LLNSTIKAATTVAAGVAASSAIPANVAALMEGMMKATFMSKLRIAMVLVLCLALFGVTVPLRTHPLGAAGQTNAGEVGTKRAGAQAGPGPAADSGAKDGKDMDRPIRSLSGHKERVTSVAYSPDGRWIATAAWDGTARIWDAKAGKEARRLDVPAPRDYHPAHLSRVLFSPDNEFVLVAQQAAPNEAGVIVWNRRSGEKVREFPAGAGCVAVSLDGRLIACGGWEEGLPVIRLYELATGKLVRQMRGPYSRVDLLTFSPDGKTLFAQVRIPRPPLGGGVERLGRDGAQLRVWDVATGNERKTGLEGAWNEHHVTLAPDGRTIAVTGLGGSKSISLRETATGGRRVELTGHAHEVMDVAFSPDGRTLASGSMDGTARLWDAFTGKEVGRFGKEVDPFKGGWVLSVVFSPDGRTLVSSGLDETAHLWDVSRITGRRRELAERSPAELEADWRDLAGDAAAGYAALGRLVSSPGSGVVFLGKQLQSLKPLDTKQIERLIADLDDGRFQVREKATRELESLADRAAPALRKALADSPSPEKKRRLSALLDRLDEASLSTETVRQIRAVEALESVGNPKARQLLDKLAAGPSEIRLTLEARAAVGRLTKRPSASP
jgi:WD40 repeat protein